MNDVEKAYIAGIIDGEGSIMLERIHGNQHPSPVISITSTTIELLNWIKEKVEKGSIIKKTNYNKEKHKDCFTYILRYNAAIELLENIYPYLIIKVKKAKAELIINQYKEVTPRNGRYSEELLKKKELFYEKFISLK